MNLRPSRLKRDKLTGLPVTPKVCMLHPELQVIRFKDQLFIVYLLKRDAKIDIHSIFKNIIPKKIICSLTSHLPIGKITRSLLGCQRQEAFSVDQGRFRQETCQPIS